MANRDIVVIGGSAGSIGPIKTILSQLPADLPAAVVIVVHVPSNSRGIYASIASMGGGLPIKVAEDGDTIELGQTYIAPPNHHLLITGKQLRLGNGPRENLVRPAIDPLFRSAAIQYGPRAIGVVLSGMLNDGAAGLSAIKQCGGIALVQAPRDASASEMPLAALEATPVDLSAAAPDLAPAISHYVNQIAGDRPPVPADLHLEVAIANGGPTNSPDIAKIAGPSTFTCPDCGGVISEVNGSIPLRFRCQVGHAFTAKALLTQKEESVDEAVRVALRIIEERAGLVSRMSNDAKRAKRMGMAEMYQKRAAEYRGYAETLRRVVVRGMEETPGDLGYVDDEDSDKIKA